MNGFAAVYRNKYLIIGGECFDPVTRIARNPDTGSVTFYTIDASGTLVPHALGTVVLNQFTAVVGVGGAIIDITGVTDLLSLIGIVSLTVAGQPESGFFLLKNMLQQLSVGGPSITITRGPIDDESKGMLP